MRRKGLRTAPPANGYDAFQISLRGECEQLLAVSLDLIAIQNAPAFPGQDGAEALLTFDPQGVRQILAVTVEQVEGDKPRLATPEQVIVKQGLPNAGT